MRNTKGHNFFCSHMSVVAVTLVLLTISFSVVGARLKDPTRPPQVSAVSTSQVSARGEDYRLSSIRIRSGSKIAVLNGQSISEGQRLGQSVVRKIESNRVILSRNGKRRVLTLFPNTLNKQSHKAP